MDRLRFPIAALFAGLIVSMLFGLLHAASTVRSQITESMALSKVEFVRLRTSMEIEEKKREKAQIEKPEQAPVTPTMQIAILSLAATRAFSGWSSPSTAVEARAESPAAANDFSRN